MGDLGRHIFQRVRARERAGDLGGQPREEARGDEDAGEQAEGLVPACRLQVWWGFVWVCWCVGGLVGVEVGSSMGGGQARRRWTHRNIQTPFSFPLTCCAWSTAPMEPIKAGATSQCMRLRALLYASATVALTASAAAGASGLGADEVEKGCVCVCIDGSGSAERQWQCNTAILTLRRPRPLTRRAKVVVTRAASIFWHFLGLRRVS